MKDKLLICDHVKKCNYNNSCSGSKPFLLKNLSVSNAFRNNPSGWICSFVVRCVRATPFYKEPEQLNLFRGIKCNLK